MHIGQTSEAVLSKQNMLLLTLLLYPFPFLHMILSAFTLGTRVPSIYLYTTISTYPDVSHKSIYASHLTPSEVENGCIYSTERRGLTKASPHHVDVDHFSVDSVY